jgi:hypothetical protein
MTIEKFIAGIALAVCAASAALASTDPLRLHGEGSLRWFGLKIYEARLFAPQQFAPQQTFQAPFALELTYSRTFAGEKIAQVSIDEIKRLGIGNKAQHEQWLAQMKGLFPSVAPGDRLRGVHQPGQGAEFFFNDRPIGMVKDPAFSSAFFSIWLDPKTAEPGLRRSLLGLAQ